MMSTENNRCTVCGKDWPDCGHLDEGMPGAPGSEDFEDEDETEDGGLTYRKRGRPKLPPGMRRREKLVIALTGDELKAMMHVAADSEGGPLRVQDWARNVLISASREKP